MLNTTKKTPLIIGLVVIIIILAVGAFFCFKKYHKKNNNTISTPSAQISTTQKQGTSIHGKVVDEQNNPVQDAIIDWQLYSSSTEKNKNNAGITDKSGQYTINNIFEGKKQIIAYKDHLAAAIDFDIIKDTQNNIPDLKLLPSDTLEGTCYEKETNKPLSGVNIKIKIPKWSDMEIIKTSDNDGKYHFFLIPEGSYTISAQKDSYTNLDNQITVTKGKITTSDFTLNKNSDNTTTNNTNNNSSSSSDNNSNSSSNSTSNTSNTNNSSITNNTNSNSSSSSDSTTTNSDGTYSVISETINLGGYSATVYHPNNSNTYPGILVLNGFSAETLAKYGYYVAAIEPESTEAAGSIIDGMKSQTLCSDKVGVTGFSWGGAMSMEIGAKTKKASAVFEMAGLLIAENGINLATDMPCPVYFITGENDDLAKPADVQAMYDQLRSGGQAGEIYIVPGEGHGYSDSAMSTLYSKALSFFSSYLN